MKTCQNEQRKKFLFRVEIKAGQVLQLEHKCNRIMTTECEHSIVITNLIPISCDKNHVNFCNIQMTETLFSSSDSFKSIATSNLAYSNLTKILTRHILPVSVSEPINVHFSKLFNVFYLKFSINQQEQEQDFYLDFYTTCLFNIN